MRKVELRMNEEFKYKVIKKLVETNGNKNRAAIKLNRSIRQINRMIAGYREKERNFLYMVIEIENQHMHFQILLKQKLNNYI